MNSCMVTCTQCSNRNKVRISRMSKALYYLHHRASNKHLYKETSNMQLREMVFIWNTTLIHKIAVGRFKDNIEVIRSKNKLFEKALETFKQMKFLFWCIFDISDWKRRIKLVLNSLTSFCGQMIDLWINVIGITNYPDISPYTVCVTKRQNRWSVNVWNGWDHS